MYITVIVYNDIIALVVRYNFKWQQRYGSMLCTIFYCKSIDIIFHRNIFWKKHSIFMVSTNHFICMFPAWSVAFLRNGRTIILNLCHNISGNRSFSNAHNFIFTKQRKINGLFFIYNKGQDSIRGILPFNLFKTGSKRFLSSCAKP